MVQDENNLHQQSFVSSVRFRRSWIMLACYLVIVEIALVITSMLIRLPESFIIAYIGGIALYVVNIIIDIFLALVNVFCILVLVLQWYNGYYEILPGKILYNDSDDFLKRQEKEFNCSAVTHVTLTQNSLGKVFNFGTLLVYSSNTNEPFYLYDIPDLKSNLPIIENALNAKPNTSSSSSNMQIQ